MMLIESTEDEDNPNLKIWKLIFMSAIRLFWLLTFYIYFITSTPVLYYCILFI